MFERFGQVSFHDVGSETDEAVFRWVPLERYDIIPFRGTINCSMSRQVWIRTRLVGWSLILFWFVLYELNLFLPLLGSRLMDMLNGFLGAVGTFAVLLGFYKLSKTEA